MRKGKGEGRTIDDTYRREMLSRTVSVSMVPEPAVKDGGGEGGHKIAHVTAEKQKGFVKEGLNCLPGGEISVATAKAMNWRWPSD